MKNETKGIFLLRTRENGNELEDFKTLEEAQEQLASHEKEDKNPNDYLYTPNFYEIYNEETEEVEDSE